MNKNKGFTLIELLVVIAIIGILASVVLASLSSARNKGKDAAVKSQLASMRAQAELYFSKADTYDGLCNGAIADNGFGGSTGPGLLLSTKDSAGVAAEIAVDSGNAGDASHITCNDSVDAWAVEAPLTDSTNPAYCVDSAGGSKALPANTHLAAGTYVCPN